LVHAAAAFCTAAQTLTARTMRRSFEEANKGALDYEEFCQLHEFIMKTQQTFLSFDTNRDGFLSREEVRQALTQSGVATAPVLSMYSVAVRTEFVCVCVHAVRLHHAVLRRPAGVNGVAAFNHHCSFDEPQTFVRAHVHMQQAPAQRPQQQLKDRRTLSMPPQCQRRRHPCAGFALDEHAFDALFAAYDPVQRAALDLAEFLGLLLFVRAASGVFAAFDPARHNSVTLNFNQFVYAASHTR
jgi:EF-hand domain